MGVPVYTFSMSVTVTKMVKRDGAGLAARYTGADRQIDLTPYLGEAGSVRTSKVLTQCSGAFEISFGDQMEADSQDTLYARIEPMDMVEIRATRFPEDHTAENLPLIMRGFVDLVRRSESVGDDGRPRRAVVITGHDMGKLWEIHQVFWELAIVQEKPMLTSFGLQAALGLKVEMNAVSDFMRLFVDKVMNVKIAELEAFSQQTVKHFTADATVEQGQLIPSRIGEIGDSTYWGIISSFADRPWNEMFIRELEAGPQLVFREAPFKGLDGKLIMPFAKDPGTVETDIAEVVQLDVGRSDSRVSNFFWTPPGSSSLDSNQQASVGSLVDGSALDFNYGNNNPALYGERKMEVGTNLQPPDLKDLPANLPTGEQVTAAGQYLPWYRLRAKQLQAMNRDNSVLEDGGVVVMGREDYVIGQYLRLYRGDLTSEAYMVSVSHAFQPMNAWTTSIQLERGTGFLARLKITGSPFLAEKRSGPYTS